MAKGVLALNSEGDITYCTVDPENRGKGRCNHVAHQNPGESTQDFIDRISIKQQELIDNKNKKDEIKESTKQAKEISQDEINDIAKKIDEIAGVKLTPDNYEEVLSSLTPDQISDITKLSFDAAPKFSLPISDEKFDDENVKNKLYFANLPKYGIGNNSAISQMFDKVGEVPLLRGTAEIVHSYSEGLDEDEYFQVQFGSTDALINKGVSTSKPGFCIYEDSTVFVKGESNEMVGIKWKDISLGARFEDDSEVIEIRPWQEKPCYEVKIEGQEKIVLSYDHLVLGEIIIGDHIVDNLEKSKQAREYIGETDKKWICIEDIYNFYNLGAEIKLHYDSKIEYIEKFRNLEPVKVRCISTNTGFYFTNGLVNHNTARKLFYCMSDTQVVDDCGGPYIDAMHCKMPEGHVCQKCANLTPGGENIKSGQLIGAWISTNMSEALTQMSMKQKHVGGTQIKKQMNTAHTIMSTLDGFQSSPIVREMAEAQTTEEMRDILYNGLKEAYANANIKQDEFNIQMTAKKLTSYKRGNNGLRPVQEGEKADVVSMSTVGNANNIFKVAELSTGYKHLTRPMTQVLKKDAANQILR